MDPRGTEGMTLESPPLTDAHPATLRAGRLPLGLKAQYGFGALVELTVGSMLNIFVLFYATAVCGLPGWMAGVALGVGLVVDAVMEPLIGSLTDGWRSKFGRRVPFMAAGLVPILVAFNLMFALPTAFGHAALFVWLMFLSVSLRIALSVFTLPYQALGAELSDDYAERSSIAAWRWGIGIFGTIAVIVLAYGVFLTGEDGMSRRDAYLPLTLSLSIIIIMGALVATRVGLVTRDRQHQLTVPVGGLAGRLVNEVAEMFRSQTFVVLLISALLFNVGAGINSALSLHLGTFFWGLTPAQIQPMALAAVLGLGIAAPLTAPLTRRMEKRTMLIIGKFGLFFFAAAPITLKLLGGLTLTGNHLSFFLAGATFLGGVSQALGIIAFLSITADAADEHEYRFGTRREGLYYAGWSFATKAATGAGVLIAGVALQLIRFPSNVAELGAAATQIPRDTINWLGIVGGPGAGLLSVVAIGLIFLYRVDRKMHTQIMQVLGERRGTDRHAPQA